MNCLRFARFAKPLVLALFLGIVATGTQARLTPVKEVRKKAQRGHQPVLAQDNAQASYASYGDRPEVMAQAEALAHAQQLDPAWVRSVLSQARVLPSVSRLILPPPVGTPKNWQAYRERFVEPIRINAGVMFWQAHAKTLARAEQTYGVPAKILVGIIGVETLYGRNTGNFRVIDALATLAFDFPQEHPKAAARQAFFRDELGYFLAISHQNGQNPLRTKGSYAGAMGLPQFMPSSIAKYAVDFDGDGKIDLHNSVDDVIGSVAHYFQAFHWQPGMPTHYPMTFDMQKLDMPTLMAPDILPTFDVPSFSAKGIVLNDEGVRHTGKLALIELQNGAEPPTYIAGTDNFYAITRYNWSSYYAKAVIDLGDAVAAKMGRP